MSTQANIISFSRATKVVNGSRPSVSASKTAAKKPTKRPSTPFTQPPNNRQTTGKKPTNRRQSLKQTANRRASASAKTSQEASEEAYEEASNDESSEERGKISKFSEIRRNHNKNKAEKNFSRHYGDSSSSASSAASTSRAALYKGDMGKKHKKAHKMQQDSSSSMSSSSGFKLRNSPRIVATLTVAACLALSCWFLFPVAQRYYQTIRHHEQLQAEYIAIEERNEMIQDQVDYLSSPIGIEDRARAEFGWVKEGEQSAAVYGLGETEEQAAYPQSVAEGSVKPPDTWYSVFLDKVFGVQ